MTLPVKQSIAVVIRNAADILVLRRPDDDDELPGIWGLPAGSFRAGETVAQLIARIGADKLGVGLLPIRELAGGAQQRERYRLDMALWEAEMIGTPGQGEWRWAAFEVLEAGRDRGSLCCQLALQSRP